MKLVIGGAYQGKKEYAIERYGGEANMVFDFHLFILDLLRQGIDPVEYINGHLSDYMDKVVICGDIFCGVVPADALMRKWRESLGRVLAVVTSHCDEVVRVFCGLGMKLK